MALFDHSAPFYFLKTMEFVFESSKKSLFASRTKCVTKNKRNEHEMKQPKQEKALLIKMALNKRKLLYEAGHGALTFYRQD